MCQTHSVRMYRCTKQAVLGCIHLVDALCGDVYMYQTRGVTVWGCVNVPDIQCGDVYIMKYVEFWDR